MSYQLIIKLFTNIKYEQKMSLEAYAKKFILTCPFISFEDIYDPTNEVKKKMLDIYERSKKTGNKSLLLYGPKGSGKTLVVHALAKQIGGIVAQIEGVNNFKIQFFVKEFARVSSEYTKRPIVIYVKNVETIVNNALPELLFLFDKFINNKRDIIFIVSSSIPPQNLPKQLKFYYYLLINSANQQNKYGLFKFLTNKFGINVNMIEQDIMNFVYQNFRNYSNYDVFQVLKSALDMKKQNGGNLQEVDRNVIENALRTVPGSLSQQIMQAFNL